MKARRPKVGVMLSIADLYVRMLPELSERYGTFWRQALTQILGEHAELQFGDVVHTEEQCQSQVEEYAQQEVDLLIVLPMAYTPSEVACRVLAQTALPVLIVSTTRDQTLPPDMGFDHLLANHGMHGVMDLTNMLRRAGKIFHVIAGHPDQDEFVLSLKRSVSISLAARVFRSGRVGRIGAPFEGMLDFTYRQEAKKHSHLFTVLDINEAEFVTQTSAIAEDRVNDFIAHMRKHINVVDDVTDVEFRSSARSALAFQDLVTMNHLDAITMNFMTLGAAGIETVPFLGASYLMTQGIGYAGEGDVLTALLTAALSAMGGQSTFTEFFCPDYERNEILLSHMGECNYALAHEGFPFDLVAKAFPWGDCQRPLVPVFQMKPGPVTLVSISETPDKKSFQLLPIEAEIVETGEHVNLQTPYARVRLNTSLNTFLPAYSLAGGTHHLALTYGHCLEDINIFSRFTSFPISAM